MLLPAETGLELPEFVTERSACVPDVTAMLTVAVSFVVLDSPVVVATVAVSAMMVPATVPVLTL